MTLKVLALDFDGVFVDCEYECYLVSMLAFRRMGEKLKPTEEVRQQVRKARAFVLTGGDYYPILKTLEEGEPDFEKMTEGKFQKLREGYRDRREEFTERFYQVREQFQKRNPIDWKRLNFLNKRVIEAVKELSEKYKMVIATGKDNRSVELLLKEKELGIEKIYSKEDSEDKKGQMKLILKDFDVKPEEILFIDDMLPNLEKVREIGVKLALAGWGYSNEKQKERAGEMGIPVLEKDKLAEGIEKLESEGKGEKPPEKTENKPEVEEKEKSKNEESKETYKTF